MSGLVAKWVLLAGLLGYLAWAAVHEPPPFLSWPMFSRLGTSRLDLYVRRDGGPWRRLDPWEHLVVFDAQMPLLRVDGLLAYLRDVHGYDVAGTVWYTDETGEYELGVHDGQLAG